MQGFDPSLLSTRLDYSGLVPDAGQAVDRFQQSRMVGMQARQTEEAARSKQVAGELVAESIGLSADELIKLPKAKEFATADPEGFLALYTAAQNKDAAAIKNLREQNDFQSKIIGNIKKLAPEKRGAAFLTLAQQYQSSDPDLAAELLDLYNMPPEQQAQQIDAYAIQSDIGDEFFGAVASSTIGKLQSDRARAVQLYGEGSPQVKQFDAAIQKETSEQGSNRGVQFLPTAKGYAVGNLATGEINLPEGALMPATSDVGLKTDLAEAEKTGAAEGELVKANDLILQDAPRRIAKLVSLRKLSDQLGEEGGPLSNALKNQISKIIPGFAGATIEEARSALTTEGINALQGFKGPTTDFEYGRALESGAQIGNTKEGNRQIIDRLTNSLRTDIDLAKERKRFKKQGGRIADFDTDAWLTEKGYFNDQQTSVNQPAQTQQVTPQGGVKFLGFE